MEPEEKLDTLLALPTSSDWRPVDADSTQSQNGHDGLQALLDAADRVAELSTAEPSLDFTARLEAQFLAHIDELQEHDGVELVAVGDTEAALLRGDDSPTLPGSWWLSEAEETTEADIDAPWPPAAPWRASRPRSRWRRLLWPVAAAVLLLALGASTFLAAAASGPGAPLYGLHRWEQGVQVTMASSAAERTRLHLTYAEEALAALNAAAARHQSGGPYIDALATLNEEIQAAATSLNSVSAGSDRTSLSSQLSQLRAQGRADLHIALSVLPWPGRVMTTAVLGAIGDTVLRVNGATMVYFEDSSQDQHLWQITVTGSGFAPGAVLLVNGAPAGTVSSVTPTRLVAQMPGDDSGPLPGSIGVADPDNTAAQTSDVSSQDQQPEQSTATPSPQSTPDGDNHGGGGHDGGNSTGGGSSGGSGVSGSSGH
jgi:IPT/TIG domain